MINDKPIHVTFPSGQIASNIVNLLIHKKPIGASRRSQYPYYNEKYAKWVKRDIDRMIETRQELVYDFSTFCTEQSNISPITLLTRIRQGIRFLIDCLDTQDATYARWYDDVEISKSQKLGGVAITWKPEFVGGSSLQPRLAESVKEIPKWEKDMEEWLESDSMKPFVKEHLMLDSDVVVRLNNKFEGVQGVLVSITSSSIKIVKTL